MPDTKITALTAISTVDPAVDVLPIVDVSDTTMAASGTTKKITSNQILGAGGTATLASATITGALTVGTGANAAVLKASFLGGYSVFENSAGTGNPSITFNNDLDTGIRAPSANTLVFDAGGFEQYRIASSGVFTWSDGAGGTRMTLNSTGLGVGVASPTSKLTIGTGSYSAAASGTTGMYTTASGLEMLSDSYFFGSRTGGVLMTLTAAGQVGIGVAPSAWTTSYNALNIGSGGSIAAYKSANYDQLYVGSNFFENTSGAWRFVNNGYATQYWHNSGSHVWRISTTSNAAGANQPLTWTQAMTLDASGNLLVGKTATGVGTVGNEIKAVGEFYSTQSASTNANFTYHVYSTGAAAYRFYVGLGGTVYATNTTISAISDARLKENVQDIDVGLDAILALKPRKFDWKNGKGKNIKGDRGFIAQEFETVFPNLVDEWKDPAPEGEAPYKSVRQDLIPVLVKAIQELTARVEALEA